MVRLPTLTAEGNTTAPTRPQRLRVVGRLAVMAPPVIAPCGFVVKFPHRLRPAVAEPPVKAVPGASTIVWPATVSEPALALVGGANALTTPHRLRAVGALVEILPLVIWPCGLVPASRQSVEPTCRGAPARAAPGASWIVWPAMVTLPVFAPVGDVIVETGPHTCKAVAALALKPPFEI